MKNKVLTLLMKIFKAKEISSLIPPFMITTFRFILSSTTTSVHSFKSNTKSIFCSPMLGDSLARFGKYPSRYPVALSGDPLASLAINNLVILIIDYQVFREKLLQVNHKQSRKVNSS
ncbi:hypothetical protein PV325_012117 [Microctonus aethiopoides]|nr:hypothetical protein PV325_012117 [Microctonus aethiopoides]